MSQQNLNIPTKAGAYHLRGRKASLQKPEECVMTRTLRTGVMVPCHLPTVVRGLRAPIRRLFRAGGSLTLGSFIA